MFTPKLGLPTFSPDPEAHRIGVDCPFFWRFIAQLKSPLLTKKEGFELQIIQVLRSDQTYVWEAISKVELPLMCNDLQSMILERVPLMRDEYTSR